MNIVIPMAGHGSRFEQAGYSFPKPLIPVGSSTMIERVVSNIRPKCDHKFIFICRKEHLEKYDVYNVLKIATGNNFEIVELEGPTEGAACSVLCGMEYIENEEELLIVNSDQIIDIDINDFIGAARSSGKDGFIMTFHSTHPKWSYARMSGDEVIEVAEKKVISEIATVGIYYYKHGRDFVDAALGMIEKDMRFNNEFYVCPVYNEMILGGKKIGIYDMVPSSFHSLGTPEDLEEFLK